MRRTAIIVTLSLLTIGFISAAAYTLRNDDGATTSVPTIAPLPGGELPAAIRLTVTDSGIAAIRAEKLRQSLLAYDAFSADSLSLTRDGAPVPFHIVGDEEDGTLYFYAQAITNTMDAPAVYWLKAQPGVAMETRDAQPTSDSAENGAEVGQRHLHWEQNDAFLAQAQGSDTWLGPRIFAPSEFTLPLNDIHATGGAGQITVNIWSNNAAPPDPDHHLIVQLNGTELADHYWEGIKEEIIVAPVPAGVLRDGENTVTLIAPGDTGAAGEALYLDWIQLEYEGRLLLEDDQLDFVDSTPVENDQVTIVNADESTLVFDITNPDAPVVLTNPAINDDGATYVSGGLGSAYVALQPEAASMPRPSAAPSWPTTLRSAENAADYVILVADEDEFEPALQPLIEHREAQGLSTMLVPVQQAYDEFAHGRQTPDALRDFLAFATNNWATPPRYALLVGDASYDMHSFENGKNQNLLPSFLVFTEYAGHVASDTLFSIFDDTLAPQIAIGRFPVQNARQLRTLVDKTIAYESADAQPWHARALLVADDEPHFDVQSDKLADQLNGTGFDIQKLYMTENEDIRDAIMGAINHGVGIINYVGHGSVRVWGDERVFRADDAETLLNNDRLPIFTTFTCLNGYFNHPNDDALAETLLWAEDGGIVAAIAPSGRSLPTQQDPLAEEFYNLLLSSGEPSLGEALRAAKVAGSDDPYLAEVIHTFNLLGDPALRFHLPQEATP